MKQRRVSLIGALVAIIGAVAFITGCQQANNNKDKAVAIYVGTMEDHGVTITNTVTFTADRTWALHVRGENASMVTMQGTYTGDPSKDGTVSITIKKELNKEGTALVDHTGPNAIETITISGGKFTIDSLEFIRQ